MPDDPSGTDGPAGDEDAPALGDGLALVSAEGTGLTGGLELPDPSGPVAGEPLPGDAGDGEFVGCVAALGVGLGLGVAVGLGVGVALGRGVGVGVGVAVGRGVGVDDPPVTTTVPFMNGWSWQWYGYVPGVSNVSWNVWPLSRIPLPVNAPATSGVTVCCSGSLPIVQSTLSPAAIITLAGV